MNVYNVFCEIVYDLEEDAYEETKVHKLSFKEFEELFTNVTTNRDLIIMLMNHEHGYDIPSIFKILDEMLDKIKKEKKKIEIIKKIRDFVYKSYHLTIPLDVICKFAINKYKNEHFITDLLVLCAKCSDEIARGNKDILVYEKFFIKLVAMIQ
jgi:hypothetical protein